MFTFALLIGIYSYLIFSLGIMGLLYKNLIIWSTLIFLGFILVWKRKAIILSLTLHVTVLRNRLRSRETLLLVFLVLFFFQALVNLLGALGPELAFDALWYHMTLPKLYLENHSVFYIPGGLLYYSAMPKLGEMLYIAGLAFGSEIWAKLIHFSFGLLTCLALYKLQRKFFNPLISMIGVLIFYSNLVVAWESITAYVDLIRTFFEVMTLWAFINWWGNQKRKWLILSAVMVGFAITTKLLAIGSLVIFGLLMIYKFSSSKFIGLFVYWLIALAIPLPWFIFAYINTGNPVYPFFSQIYKIVPESLTVLDFFEEIWNLFTNSPDPLSPLYIILLPIIVFGFSKFRPEIKIISLYCALAIVVWCFTPQTGGGRFILPYLPALSIVCAASLSFFIENKKSMVLTSQNF